MDVGVAIRHHWDRIAAWGAIAVGGLVVLIGWFGVSATPFVFEQLPYVVSGGVGGLFLLGLGAALLLSADLRDEWRKLDNIEHALLNADGLPWAAARSTHAPGHEHDGPATGDPEPARATKHSVAAATETQEAPAPPHTRVDRRSGGSSKKAKRREPLRVGTGSSS